MPHPHRILLVLAALACATGAQAQQWRWFGPYELEPADSRLTRTSGAPAAAARFTTSAAGDLQWVYMGLDLPTTAVVDSVAVCYELESTGSYITGVRFIRMAEPSTSAVLLDLSADLASPTAECVVQDTNVQVPQRGLLHLGLRLNYGSPGDWIEIGAIGVRLAHDPTPVPDQAPAQPRLLDQNHPNPFNPSTRIAFELPREEQVSLAIYTVDGAHVATLLDDHLPAGKHSVQWNGRDDRGRVQASGVYLYRLEAGDWRESRQMTLIR